MIELLQTNLEVLDYVIVSLSILLPLAFYVEKVLPRLASKFMEESIEKVSQSFISKRYSEMGKASGEVRAEKGFMGAVALDAIQGANPVVGMIMKQFPEASRWVKKNPEYAPEIISWIQRIVPPEKLEEMMKGFMGKVSQAGLSKEAPKMGVSET